MANTTVKGKFNVVAENGDVQTIYPKTTGDQVLVDRSSNASVIPNDVANLQHIVNKMGSLALKSKVETSDFTTGTMISSLEDLKSNTNTGKIADATVVKDIESRVDTLENSNLVTVDELDAGLATKPDTEINDSVTSTSLTWSSKKLSDQLTTLNSNTQLLTNRVDNLSTLQEGSTTGDAELIGIRTGYNSINYPSAGDAVREQISSVIDFINNKSLLKKTLNNNITDLNDISEHGIYFISSSQAVSIANTANQTDGFILIDYNDNNSATRHYQIVITYSDQILYLRNNKNGIWTAWRRIIDENRFNVLVNPIMSNINTITSNINKCFKQVSDVTDCNDAPTGYIYFPASSGISNLPTNGRGVLFTNIGSSNNIFQFYMEGTGKIYSRTKNSDTWNDWKKYSDSEYTFGPVEIDQHMDIDDLTSFNAYYIPSTYVTNKLPSNNGGVLFNYIYPNYITTRHYQMFMAYLNNKIYIRNKNNGVFTDWKELLSASSIQQNASTTTSNLIKKDSETQYTIYFGDFNIKLVRVDNDTTNSHLWNIYDIRKELDILVPIGTDIVGPIKEVGEADFMGGLHGDETTTMFEVYCDGCIYDMNSLTTFNTLDILMKSDLYRVSSKEKIAERIVHISISNNKIHVHSQIKATVGFNVERCTNGGLIAARNNIITGLFINNYIANEVQNTSINGIASKDNTTAIIFTTLGTIKVQNIIGHERNTYKGYISVFTSENPMRTKIYFDTISSGSTSIQANETITGEFEYTFNK